MYLLHFDDLKKIKRFWFTQVVIKSSGAPKAAKIGSGDATVQRVNAEVGNALALLLVVNVTLMFVGIAGLGNEFHNDTLIW